MVGLLGVAMRRDTRALATGVLTITGLASRPTPEVASTTAWTLRSRLVRVVGVAVQFQVELP